MQNIIKKILLSAPNTNLHELGRDKFQKKKKISRTFADYSSVATLPPFFQ